MVAGGVVTVYVSDMDRAVKFYTEVLGLKLQHRFGDHWAQVEAPNGLNIGLHPGAKLSEGQRQGGMNIGFYLSGSIGEAVATLKARGVAFQAEAQEGKALQIAHFADPDGNPLYICEMKAEYKHTEPGRQVA